MASCATACVIFGQVRCIGKDFQYHTTGIELDYCLFLECGIIQEFFTHFIVFLVGVFCSEAMAPKVGSIVLSIALV